MVNDGQADSHADMLKMASILTEMGPPVLALLAPQAGERILDLGCGTGVWAGEMMRRGCEVVGVDTNPRAIEAAKARGVDARLINAESLAFDAEFDAVFSNASLHWMRHPGRVIACVARALKPGGRFVGECGEENNVRTVLDAVATALDRRGIEVDNLHPWVFVTRRDATALLEAGGFDVRSVEVIERPTVLPGTLAQWLSVFATNYLSCLHPKEREVFLDEVTALCRPKLLRPDGRWFVDYVRLRFFAVKR